MILCTLELSCGPAAICPAMVSSLTSLNEHRGRSEIGTSSRNLQNAMSPKKVYGSYTLIATILV